MTGTRVSISRLALTGALTMLILFAACWLAAVAGGLAASHAYIGLFTTAAPTSPAALAIGGFWSLVWGGAAGALAAIFYNSLGFAEREKARPGPAA